MLKKVKMFLPMMCLNCNVATCNTTTLLIGGSWQETQDEDMRRVNERVRITSREPILKRIGDPQNHGTNS